MPRDPQSADRLEAPPSPGEFVNQLWWWLTTSPYPVESKREYVETIIGVIRQVAKLAEG